MRAALWVLAASVLLGACGNGSDPRSGADSGPGGPSTTTTTIPPAPHLFTTTTLGVQLLPPTAANRNGPTQTVKKWSWTGQRFDLGVIREIHPLDGAYVLSFDREALRDAHGTRSGAQFTTEPIVVGSDSTVEIVDDHGPLRLFGVRADATVTQLSDSWSCAEPAAWDPSSMAVLASDGIGSRDIDTLTFDAQGQVTAIRLSRRC